MKKLILLFALAFLNITLHAQQEERPIELRTMGSSLFGGSVTKTENGETFHGDHGYAQYFIPAKSHT